jgi:Protein of unknown function (DUF2938)
MAILEIIIVGVVATLTLDIWQQIYRVAFGTPITDWAIIGRWAANLPRGQIVNENIGSAPAVPHEHAIGWVVHYLVGIGYAVVYLVLMWFILGIPPSFISAMIFGAISVSVTWFAMEPILGAGVMASKTPNRQAAMIHDFTSHLSFGFGLFLGTVIFRALFGAA